MSAALTCIFAHSVTSILGLNINISKLTSKNRHAPSFVPYVTKMTLCVRSYLFTDSARASHQLFSNIIFCSISRLENMLPKIPPSTESGEGSPDRANSSQSLPASRNGVTEPSTTPSTSTPSTKEHGNLPIIVPMIPPPLIKPPAGREHNTFLERHTQ